MRECSTGESGGEATRGWVAPASSTSFHLTGYPGGLKFPGRKQDFIWNIGNEIGGILTRGGGGEVKTRQAEPGGDGGVRGGEIFLQRSQEGGLNAFNFASAFSLTTWKICSVKQTQAVDS